MACPLLSAWAVACLLLLGIYRTAVASMLPLRLQLASAWILQPVRPLPAPQRLMGHKQRRQLLLWTVPGAGRFREAHAACSGSGTCLLRRFAAGVARRRELTGRSGMPDGW